MPFTGRYGKAVHVCMKKEEVAAIEELAHKEESSLAAVTRRLIRVGLHQMGL